MLTVEQILAAPEEEYMNEDQLEFFRALIVQQLEETHEQINDAKEQVRTQQYEADELDKAAVEEERRFQLRMIDRLTKLEPKLKEALKRIEDGDFGFCEVTGEPIGVRRLMARPTATLCAEEKQRQEMQEKNFRDD
ncbi:TraR/DksA C4-type zinc finger protein [Salinibius halmophilus]|uniref:TraR/DksA C4-type zinc finger protein n=1 Tax=Salinibius halmophilus TaxID=1853216 RepID=UPI000E666B15|nr:TraR/DksA C4-type zinc finger protein [Salinibius halmophilus]